MVCYVLPVPRTAPKPSTCTVNSPQKLSFINIPCTLVGGASCEPCKDLQKLQSYAAQATSSYDAGTYIDVKEHQIYLWRNRNRIHDPFSIFPFEIKSLIFRLCYDSSTRGIGTQLGIASVCKSWRDMAIRTSTLWATVPISGDVIGLEYAELWIARARNSPLSFLLRELRGDSPEVHSTRSNVIKQVIKYNAHIRALDATAFPFSPRIILRNGLPEPTTWPILSHIITKGWYIDQGLELLRRCPGAIHVEFWNLLSGLNLPGGLPVHHSRMRSLTVAFDVTGLPNDLLQYLTTPALTTLEASFSSCEDCPASRLNDFLRRSKCSLHTLRLGDAEFNTGDLMTLLYNQPSLRVLITGMGPFYHYHRGRPAIYDWLMRLLLTNSRGELGVGKAFTTGSFLPRLERLEFTGIQQCSTGALFDVYSSHSALAHVHQQGNSLWGFKEELTYRPLRFLRVESRKKYEFTYYETFMGADQLRRDCFDAVPATYRVELNGCILDYDYDIFDASRDRYCIRQ